MSLPKELLEQLLSGYLDDALTADERVRVEQLLESNSEIADELEQLRDLRRSLQVLSRVDSDIRLEKGFADRVLGAAVARAREEGLGDDHPLIRLAEQPSTSLAPTTSSWRLVGYALALAASVALAVVLLRPQTGADPNMIAKSNPQVVDSQGRDEVHTSDENIDVETGPMLVDNPMPVDNPRPSATDVAAGSADPSLESMATGEPQGVDTVPSVVGGNPLPPMDSIASADGSSVNPDTTTPAADNRAVPLTQLGAILVMDVRRTDEGRRSHSVVKAMEASDIARASRKEVTEQVAGFVAGNVEDKAEDATVLYLQLPAKQFDLFYRSLWADEEGIESVRMTIAVNAPFLQVVDSVKPSPVAVRHEAAAYELFSQSGVVDHLVHELSQLSFPEVDRENATTSGLLGSGPDIQAQVLVLVR